MLASVRVLGSPIVIPRISRRSALSGAAYAGAAAALSGLWPGRVAAGVPERTVPDELSGSRFDLCVLRAPVPIEGRRGEAITINGSVPGPLLRWREGDEVVLRVKNELDEDTSIHWHGILVPYGMDGVPGVSFPGIAPGETFEYRFPVRQAGTYWYHSHSGLQEQSGHYGALVIEPAKGDPVAFDREHVLVLGDWTFSRPEWIFERLKKSSESFNFGKPTLGGFFREAGSRGFGAALRDRAAWARMRMSVADLADVTGAAYTYLVNGCGPADNWTGRFQAGERVRLRFVNAAAMTLFNIRIPGLPMTVVQADGLDIQPVEIDEFQIGVAETFDVIVTPRQERAFTVMCEAMDRSGYGRATLAPAAGFPEADRNPSFSAEVPPLRKPPRLTMRDMGHGGHRDSPSGSEHAPSGTASHGGMGHAGMDHGEMDHAGMDGTGASSAPQPHDHPKGPGVANLAAAPVSRLAEPGLGLDAVPHRALSYADLVALSDNPDARAPERELELHLTGNMRRYMWSFDGVKYSDAEEPIVFREGERLRLILVNDTMMVHPVHLHGMFFEVETGAGRRLPRKHTISVKPGERLPLLVTADAPGDWAFHCHLLYHMRAGMMRVVSVQGPGSAASVG